MAAKVLKGEKKASEMNFEIIEEAAFYGNNKVAENLGITIPAELSDKSGQALLYEIKFYRRIELWGEGFSWFDFKRRKDTIVRHTFEDGGNYMTNAAVTINPEDANNWMWVIPAKEYEYNNAINKQ